VFEVESIEEWQGQDVLDRDGDRIGKLEDLFSDTEDGSPSLGCVKSGRLAKRFSIVPLAGASLGRNHVRLPYSKDQVDSAPQVGDGGRITRADELLVARHFGVQAPERDCAEDDVRYEQVAAAEERRVQAQAARDRAAELEAEAERKQAEAESRHSDAASAGEEADAAEAERRRLLEEAAAIRSRADG
jgi:sporulation protein YlmC with PRC-barrel domain